MRTAVEPGHGHTTGRNRAMAQRTAETKRTLADANNFMGLRGYPKCLESSVLGTSTFFTEKWDFQRKLQHTPPSIYLSIFKMQNLFLF